MPTSVIAILNQSRSRVKFHFKRATWWVFNFCINKCYRVSRTNTIRVSGSQSIRRDKRRQIINWKEQWVFAAYEKVSTRKLKIWMSSSKWGPQINLLQITPSEELKSSLVKGTSCSSTFQTDWSVAFTAKKELAMNAWEVRRIPVPNLCQVNFERTRCTQRKEGKCKTKDVGVEKDALNYSCPAKSGAVLGDYNSSPSFSDNILLSLFRSKREFGDQRTFNSSDKSHINKIFQPDQRVLILWKSHIDVRILTIGKVQCFSTIHCGCQGEERHSNLSGSRTENTA